MENTTNANGQLFWDLLYAELTQQLSDYQNKKTPEIDKEAHAIRTCHLYFEKLQNHIFSYTFKDDQEEILFFKRVKPKFYSLLIYHHSLFNLLVDWPRDSNTLQQAYIKDQVSKISNFATNNRFLYTYYITEETFLDKIFFIRQSENRPFNLPIYDVNTASYFTTQYDYYFSRALANEMLMHYLQLKSEPDDLKQKLSPTKDETNKIIFTGPKIGLTELLYSLYYDKAFNNGTAKIKDIFASLEESWHVKIDNPTRSLQEILSRKGGPTTYLKHLEGELVIGIDPLL